MSKIAILSVDDEKIILDSLRIQFEKNFKNKYLFEYAESAEEALEVIDELIYKDIDILLVISDYQMPGLNGDEFAITLKQKLPNVNILMLTGQITEKLSTELLSKKIVLKVISKPWSENDLVTMIRNISV
jgi:CheY-like chemotaxis protein